MKTAKKTSILLAAVLIIIGLALSLAAFAMMDGDITKLNSMTFTENTYSAEDSFESICIDAAEADVQFAVSENGECYVDCIEGDKVYHTVEVKNNALVIKRIDNRKWYEHIGIYGIRRIDNRKWYEPIGVYWDSMKITVYLPKTEYDALYISTLSGDIEIADRYSFNTAEIYNASGDISFSAAVKNELKANTVSGNLTINNVKPNTMTVQSTSGDAALTSVETAASLFAKATSGNLTLTNVACEALTTDNTSGNTVLTDVNAGSIESESVSGEINLKRCDAAALKFKTVSGNVLGTLLSGKIFTTDTLSGSVSVPETTSGGICKITTVSGNIKITIEN